MKKNFFYLFTIAMLSSCETITRDPSPEVGSVVFWTKRTDVYYNSSKDFNIIDIELEEFATSRFIFNYYNMAPDCITDEDATFYFITPGSYKMTARDTKGKTWKGKINVQSGCNPIELK